MSVILTSKKTAIIKTSYHDEHTIINAREEESFLLAQKTLLWKMAEGARPFSPIMLFG